MRAICLIKSSKDCKLDNELNQETMRAIHRFKIITKIRAVFDVKSYGKCELLLK